MLANTQRKIKVYKFAFPLLLLTLTWTYIFISSGIFKAGFNYFLDDHQIILSYSKYTSFEDIFIKPFISLFSIEEEARFRPLYDVFRRLFSQIFGLNPFVWYFSSFLVAITTTSLFYIVAKLQDFSYLESTIFAAIIVFGEQASTYARFGTPETTSTLLIGFAFLFGTLNFHEKVNQIISNILFISFAFLASLNKESCILVLPALAFFKVWIFSQKNEIYIRDSISKNKYAIVSILSIFILFLSYIKLAGIKGPGYATVNSETFSIFNLVGSLKHKKSFGLAIFVNIIQGIVYLKSSSRNGLRININKFYILGILIIVPQLIIYNRTGIYGHYFLPVSIGIAFLIIYPIKKAGETANFYSRILMFSLVLLVTMIISLNIITTKQYFQDVHARTSSLQEMVSDLSQCTGQNSPLVIFANPYINYEMIMAFKEVMNGVIKNDHVFLATYGSENSNFITDVIKEDEKHWKYLNLSKLKDRYNNQTIESLDQNDFQKIKAIVIANAKIIEKDFNQFNLSWFEPNVFTRKFYQNLDLEIYCRR